MTTDYICRIVSATNFDIITIEDLPILMISTKMFFRNIGFNIFSKRWVVPDDISPSSSSFMRKYRKLAASVIRTQPLQSLSDYLSFVLT